MGIADVTWEDEENNRHVAFSVAYAVEGDGLTIRDLTPRSVTFLCEQRARSIRSIGVHTAAGKQLLTRQFRQSRQYAQLANQLNDRGTSLTV